MQGSYSATYSTGCDKPVCTRATLWRQHYTTTSKEYLTNSHILSIYFELPFLLLHLVKISCKLIIIWVNYERNKKGARFFETQCTIQHSRNQYTLSSLGPTTQAYTRVSYNHPEYTKTWEVWTYTQKGSLYCTSECANVHHGLRVYINTRLKAAFTLRAQSSRIHYGMGDTL